MYFRINKIKKTITKVLFKNSRSACKNIINNIGNRIKRETKRCINQKWNSQCEFLAKSKPSEQVYWKVIKNVESGNTLNKQSILPNIRLNFKKASIFAKYYKGIFNNSSFDRKFGAMFTKKEVFEPISVEETVLAIKTSKSTNSTGMDDISLKILKNIPT